MNYHCGAKICIKKTLIKAQNIIRKMKIWNYYFVILF
jgi:hypothetical protein